MNSALIRQKGCQGVSTSILSLFTASGVSHPPKWLGLNAGGPWHNSNANRVCELHAVTLTLDIMTISNTVIYTQENKAEIAKTYN